MVTKIHANTIIFNSSNAFLLAVLILVHSGALKPHHHNKVETPSVGIFHITFVN
jgi:hypothetical protein